MSLRDLIFGCSSPATVGVVSISSSSQHSSTFQRSNKAFEASSSVKSASKLSRGKVQPEQISSFRRGDEIVESDSQIANKIFRPDSSMLYFSALPKRRRTSGENPTYNGCVDDDYASSPSYRLRMVQGSHAGFSYVGMKSKVRRMRRDVYVLLENLYQDFIIYLIGFNYCSI